MLYRKWDIFEGDSEVTEVDSVIMATGYTWKFRFLEEGIVEQENGRINLYRLQGPHVGYGVREAIMTSDDRMSWPFTKGKTDETRDNIFKVLFQTVIKLLRIL
ncbi:flavin-containing monooxygenase [Trichonephila clavipes]|nr:flavin-containing monooxygenase [Trichonephila clavipes]